jgi:hypothetical protein
MSATLIRRLISVLSPFVLPSNFVPPSAWLPFHFVSLQFNVSLSALARPFSVWLSAFPFGGHANACTPLRRKPLPCAPLPSHGLAAFCKSPRCCGAVSFAGAAAISVVPLLLFPRRDVIRSQSTLAVHIFRFGESFWRISIGTNDSPDRFETHRRNLNHGRRLGAVRRSSEGSRRARSSRATWWTCDLSEGTRHPWISKMNSLLTHSQPRRSRKRELDTMSLW